MTFPRTDMGVSIIHPRLPSTGACGEESVDLASFGIILPMGLRPSVS